MVWLLKSQGMKDCKSVESFCRSMVAIYTNDWSTVWYVYCCCFFFLGNFYMCASIEQQHLLWQPGPPDILWKWASMLTKLARDGECRLALFHAIRNFLVNHIIFQGYLTNTWFFIFLNVYVSWIEQDKILISQLSPPKFRYFID